MSPYTPMHVEVPKDAWRGMGAALLPPIKRSMKVLRNTLVDLSVDVNRIAAKSTDLIRRRRDAHVKNADAYPSWVDYSMPLQRTKLFFDTVDNDKYSTELDGDGFRDGAHLDDLVLCLRDARIADMSAGSRDRRAIQSRFHGITKRLGDDKGVDDLRGLFDTAAAAACYRETSREYNVAARKVMDEYHRLWVGSGRGIWVTE